MARHEPSDDGVEGTAEGMSLTRRTALAVLGAGTVGAAMTGSASADHSDTEDASIRKWNQHIDAQGHDLLDLHALEVDHVHTNARDADALVWEDDDGTYHVDDDEDTLYSGEDFTEAVQTALDSLTDGRTTKETVVVTCSGTATPPEGGHWEDDDAAIDVPSNTILDLRGTIYVDDTNTTALRALDAENIEIPRLSVEGSWSSPFFFRSVSNLKVGHVDLRVDEDGEGSGIRIDGFAYGRGEDTIRCEDIQFGSVYVENTTHHAFETYAVDRIQVGQVIARRTFTGAGVLLNDTTDATVGAVVGEDIDYREEEGESGGYAAFRAANDAHDITVGQVICRGGARGVFGVSGSHNITVGEVNISEMFGGIFIEDCQNFTINGGVVKNCDWEAVRIHSRNDFGHSPTNGVTISNLRTYDDRPEDEREQSYGIYVSGNQTSNVRIVNCDVREGGTEQNIRVDADETILHNNHGGGLATGTVTLEGGADPAAVVEDVSPFEYQQPSLRSDPVEASGTTFAYDHYFLWNGDSEAWDLHFEWKHDPEADVDVQYVVDNPRANLGTGDSGQETELVDDLTEGTYLISAELNDDDIVMSVDDDAGLADGANVYNETVGEATEQVWEATELEDGTFRIDAANGDGLVLEAEDGETGTGTNLVLGTWEGAEYQKFEAVPRSDVAYTLEPAHADLAVDVWEVDPEPGADLRHWSPTGGNNQLFTFRDPAED
ncbi:RICIN domain-containing protein [Halomontanus rarus]|uniref:RICIN domain-containing protein n=1 Tax=Halomontanus rarus TaxID=3034020 RepID=UPI0023E8BDD1|nr:RICIN domain-containing protein [Halovivax sp. TS33]